jgi:outer membrane protein OmpA-like peptidoglycan-associated protein
MQCEGITRAGRRCRNRALDDEIFCEIHLRVNRTYNLALLVPFLTILLIGYFFVYGMYFDTLIYGVFELNYLKYAGITDFFISLFRTGGMLTVVVLKLWFVYTLLMGLVFTVALLGHMIFHTSRKHLQIGRRLKIIGLSLGIFILNFLHMFIFILPKRDRGKPSHLLIGREHLARTLLYQKIAAAKSLPGEPVRTASNYYQKFLNFSSFRNHRFSATLSLLVLISALSLYHAGQEARETRSCIIAAAEKKSPPHAAAVTLFPGLNIASLCQKDIGQTYDDNGMFTDFIYSLANFFTFPVVVFDIPANDKPVVFLGSTERYELFFNGETRLPFALPKQTFSNLYQSLYEPEGVKHSNSSELEKSIEKNTALLKKLTTKISHSTTYSDEGLKQRLERIEIRTNRSFRKLQDLERGLDSVIHDLFSIEKSNSLKRAANLPEGCWAVKPSLVLPFESGSVKITSLKKIKEIQELALEFTRNDRRYIVISGFTDLNGTQHDNYRLSHRRAFEVKEMMLRIGVDETTIFSFGHGENNSGDYPLRRVEIRDCTPPIGGKFS